MLRMPLLCVKPSGNFIRLQLTMWSGRHLADVHRTRFVGNQKIFTRNVFTNDDMFAGILHSKSMWDMTELQSWTSEWRIKQCSILRRKYEPLYVSFGQGSLRNSWISAHQFCWYRLTLSNYSKSQFGVSTLQIKRQNLTLTLGNGTEET